MWKEKIFFLGIYSLIINHIGKGCIKKYYCRFSAPPVQVSPLMNLIMRVVIQRVLQASVTIDNSTASEIKTGLLVFAGIEDADSTEDVIWLSTSCGKKMCIFY